MRSVLFVGMSLFGLFSFAQDQDQVQASEDSLSPELAEKVFIYSVSKRYNDFAVTRMALYALLAANPNNYALRDSLALIYLQEKNFVSAALVAQEVVDWVPDNLFATKIVATALEQLGIKDRALGYYEKLSLNETENLNYLYKIAFLQYDLERYEEALISSARIRDKASSPELMLVFPTVDSKGQEISMQLASIRLMGMIEEGRGNKDKAEEHYNAVLTEVPTFEVVRQQLEQLNK